MPYHMTCDSEHTSIKVAYVKYTLHYLYRYRRHLYNNVRKDNVVYLHESHL